MSIKIDLYKYELKSLFKTFFGVIENTSQGSIHRDGIYTYKPGMMIIGEKDDEGILTGKLLMKSECKYAKHVVASLNGIAAPVPKKGCYTIFHPGLAILSDGTLISSCAKTKTISETQFGLVAEELSDPKHLTGRFNVRFAGNKTVYTGLMINGLPNGKGALKLNNGTSLKGTFSPVTDDKGIYSSLLSSPEGYMCAVKVSIKVGKGKASHLEDLYVYDLGFSSERIEKSQVPYEYAEISD